MSSTASSQQLSSQSNRHPSQIFIKSLAGNILVVSANRSNTVGDIMGHIQCREGIRIEPQRLIFAGKQLQPNLTLADYDIHNESTLHLSLRLHGGMEQWLAIIVYISAFIFGIPIFAKLKQLIQQQIAMLTAAEEWEGEEADEE
jgi:hypothetical protein